jgi:DNA-binding NtrC family response regulator
MTRKTVLVVDHEAILLLVLAYKLDRMRIGLVPSTSVEKARSMLARIKPALNVMIINCRLQGTCAFALEIVEQRPKLTVIGLVSEGHQCTACRHLLSASVRDSEFRDVKWVNGLVSLIQRSLTREPKIVPIRKPAASIKKIPKR